MGAIELDGDGHWGGDPDERSERLEITLADDDARLVSADAKALAAIRRALQRGGRDALVRLAEAAEEFDLAAA